MAHFAHVDAHNVVQQVIVVNNDDIDFLPFPESEPVGQQFIASCGISGTYLQCSYNNNFRGRYPSPTWRYDESADIFIPPPEVTE